MELQIAAAMAAASKKISKIEIELTLENVNDFEQIESDPIYVRGFQWKVCLNKVKKGQEFFLQRVLRLLNDDASNRWAIIANLSINVASQLNKDKVSKAVPDTRSLFNSKFKSWRYTEYPWKIFADPLNGYVVNNTSTLKVALQVGKLLDTSNEELLKFETIRKCSEQCMNGTFRLTVNKINNLFGVCSPEFRLGGILWNLLLYQPDSNEGTSSLTIRLMSADFLNLTGGLSCETVVTCKLIPFDQNIQTVTRTFNKWKFNGSLCNNLGDIIDWCDLIKPENRFIQNDSCVIEIEIKITELNRIPKQVVMRPAPANDIKTIKMNCRICSESMVGCDVCTTSCGHIFHKQCIMEKLREEKSCPKCQARTFLGDLRVVHLDTE